MSRFPDLAALRKLVAASAFGKKRKTVRLGLLLFPPIISMGPPRPLAAEHVATETRQDRQRLGRWRWALLGQAERLRIRQDGAGLGMELKVESILEQGEESHTGPWLIPALLAGQGGHCKGTTAAMAASLGPANASVSWLRESSERQAAERSFSEPAFAVLQKPLGSHSVIGDNDPDCTCCSQENCNKAVLPCTTTTATSGKMQQYFEQNYLVVKAANEDHEMAHQKLDNYRAEMQ